MYEVETRFCSGSAALQSNNKLKILNCIFIPPFWKSIWVTLCPNQCVSRGREVGFRFYYQEEFKSWIKVNDGSLTMSEEMVWKCEDKIEITRLWQCCSKQWMARRFCPNWMWVEQSWRMPWWMWIAVFNVNQALTRSHWRSGKR